MAAICARFGSMRRPSRAYSRHMSDYERIAVAIDYVLANAGRQPSLAEVAAQTHLSPFHFQRLFKRWAGISPKRFLQVVTVARAKRLLSDAAFSSLRASEALGFSSASRLHDHFVTIEAMTPGEFRSQGDGLTLEFGFAPGPFGQVFIAWTKKGICSLQFVDDAAESALLALRLDWPGAHCVERKAQAKAIVQRLFGRAPPDDLPISVHVRGTNFQVAVWRALLAIPEGKFASYGQIARAVGRPSAVRAVGSAVGANPCAYIIPCHRVIRGNGEIGGYRWGLGRKQVINAWEAAASDGMLPVCCNAISS